MADIAAADKVTVLELKHFSLLSPSHRLPNSFLSEWSWVLASLHDRLENVDLTWHIGPGSLLVGSGDSLTDTLFSTS